LYPTKGTRCNIILSVSKRYLQTIPWRDSYKLTKEASQESGEQ
jgi:hypothetical protein